MPYFMRAYAEPGAPEAGAETPLRFVASTEGIKRDGRELRAEDWRVDAYLRNPIFLWAHTYDLPPIGRAAVTFDGPRMLADVEFDREDPFAVNIERKYRAGFLNAVSVGWNDVKDAEGRWTHELLDISAVPVPADPQALKTARSLALADLTEWVTTATETPAEVAWTQTATAMVRLFVTATDDAAEPQRRALYNALLPKYRRADKTPPEYLPSDHLRALGPAELRGLFLAGEPELAPELFAAQNERIGAVLSTRNRADLEQAITLIQTVIERATKPEPESSPAADTERTAEAIQSLWLRMHVAEAEAKK